MRAESFEEIAACLETVAQEQIRNQDPLGYFTASYRAAIDNMKIGIYNQRFQNLPAVQNMTLAFANRYFDILTAFQASEPIPASWRLIFKTCRRNKISVIQHLFLTMHIRIHLDLPYALSQTFSSEELTDFHSDYKAIGKTLHSYYEDLEEKVVDLYDLDKVTNWLPNLASAFPMGGQTAYVYKPLNPVEELKRTLREILLNYAKQLIRQERTHAWKMAVKWTGLPPEERENQTSVADEKAKSGAREYIYPNFILDSVFRQLIPLEMGKVSDKIRILMD